jgi:hypothetical protein
MTHHRTHPEEHHPYRQQRVTVDRGQTVSAATFVPGSPVKVEAPFAAK